MKKQRVLCLGGVVAAVPSYGTNVEKGKENVRNGEKQKQHSIT